MERKVGELDLDSLVTFANELVFTTDAIRVVVGVARRFELPLCLSSLVALVHPVAVCEHMELKEFQMFMGS